jgi:hypothetical protein
VSYNVYSAMPYIFSQNGWRQICQHTMTS